MQDGDGFSKSNTEGKTAVDLSQTRYVDQDVSRAIAKRADQVEAASPLVAALMRAAVLTAIGEPGVAGQRVIDAICAIDGRIPPAWTIEAARDMLAPVIAAMAGSHTCQAAAARQLAGIPDRIALGARPERMGEMLGGTSVYLGTMERVRTPLAIAA